MTIGLVGRLVSGIFLFSQTKKIKIKNNNSGITFFPHCHQTPQMKNKMGYFIYGHFLTF